METPAVVRLRSEVLREGNKKAGGGMKMVGKIS
jgi:hypothetical protein